MATVALGPWSRHWNPLAECRCAAARTVRDLDDWLRSCRPVGLTARRDDRDQPPQSRIRPAGRVVFPRLRVDRPHDVVVATRADPILPPVPGLRELGIATSDGPPRIGGNSVIVADTDHRRNHEHGNH